MTKNAKLVKIHNVETGEIVEREMNAQELAQSDNDEANDAVMKAAIENQKLQKAAVLTKLGLTADEVAALLG